MSEPFKVIAFNEHLLSLTDIIDEKQIVAQKFSNKAINLEKYPPI